MPNPLRQLLRPRSAADFTAQLIATGEVKTALDIGCGTRSHLSQFRPDVQTTGLDAHAEAIDLAKVRSNGYGFQIEMSYRAWCLGYRLRETPIIFVDRKEGSSKMTLTIALEAVFVVWWLRIQGILGRLGRRRGSDAAVGGKAETRP